MTIASTAEYKAQVEYAIGDASSILSSDEIESALTRALNELGWTLPVSNQAKEYWLVERGQRHCLDILRTTSAHKFRYKQINLSHRFDHYHAMVEAMDKRFLEALESDPALADVSGENFFVYIRGGFNYGHLGEDLTYLNSLGEG
ncbi:MAG: hypothetical protein ACOC80_05005 [Petrotogales bacterium]